MRPRKQVFFLAIADDRSHFPAARTLPTATGTGHKIAPQQMIDLNPPGNAQPSKCIDASTLHHNKQQAFTSTSVQNHLWIKRVTRKACNKGILRIFGNRPQSERSLLSTAPIAALTVENLQEIRSGRHLEDIPIFV